MSTSSRSAVHPQQWARHPVLRPVSRCSQLVPDLPVSSAEHGQQQQARDPIVVVITGGVGGGLMMAITCMMVNFVYVFGMGIPAASGKVAKDPITGDTQAEYKSQGTEGHGLPFVSFVGGVTGGILGGAGGTLIYLELLNLYKATLPDAHDRDCSPGDPYRSIRWQVYSP